MAGGGIAAADNAISDDDGVLATTTDSDWAVGSVCARRDRLTQRSRLRHPQRVGDGAANTFKNGSAVSVTGTLPTGLDGGQPGQDDQLPGNWDTLAQITLSGSAPRGRLHRITTALGAFTGTVTFSGAAYQQLQRRPSPVTTH